MTIDRPMSLVLTHAQTPWRPISLKTASGMAEVLAGGHVPAAVVDVGEWDPADVVREVLRLLPPSFDAMEQIPAMVEKVQNSVVKAVLPATHIPQAASIPSAAAGSASI